MPVNSDAGRLVVRRQIRLKESTSWTNPRTQGAAEMYRIARATHDSDPRLDAPPREKMFARVLNPNLGLLNAEHALLDSYCPIVLVQ